MLQWAMSSKGNKILKYVVRSSTVTALVLASFKVVCFGTKVTAKNRASWYLVSSILAFSTRLETIFFLAKKDYTFSDRT